jgi:hypothetical protein
MSVRVSVFNSGSLNRVRSENMELSPSFSGVCARVIHIVRTDCISELAEVNAEDKSFPEKKKLWL